MSKTLVDIFSDEAKNRSRPHIFGPDYYAKLAGKPSGGEKLSSTEINGVSWPPPETPRSRTPSPPPKLPKVAPPLKEFFEIDSAPSLELLKTSSSLSSLVQNKPDSPPEPPKTGPPPRELTETDGIHKALKAIVTPVQENMPNHYLEAHKDMATQELKSESYQIQSHTVQTNTSEVTSDSDLSFINFYDVQHSQVVRKSKNEDIHIPIKHTPMGVSYRSLPDGNETNVDTLNFHVQHENHLSAFKTPAVKPPVLNIQGKKEKGWFVKGPAAIKQRNISPTEKPILRRNSSESNLMDDSHDTTPKVLHHKKDNTLISKIYKDPKVRLFALHSREEIPGTDQEYIRPAFHSQLSLDSKVALNENSSWYKSHYSFDDGTTSEFESGNTGKMFFFSSEEEDLLSLNLDQSFQAADVTIKNKDIKSNEALYSAQHTSSPNPLMTPRTLSTRKFIYGSQEDLLSIDEIGSIPRRKDNTLISKIYKDPNVRNFALKAHRDFVPDYESTPVSLKPRELFTSDDEQSHTDSNMIIHKRTSINKPTYGSYDDLSSAEISIETHQNHQSIVNPILYSTQQGSVEDGYNSEDLNVNEIARRHVVRQTLGKFSKSEINIKSGFHRSPSLEEGDNIRVSVRDLRKKFENSTGSSKPVISSLTARSLSKQVKESLRQ